MRTLRKQEQFLRTKVTPLVSNCFGYEDTPVILQNVFSQEESTVPGMGKVNLIKFGA